jgi:F0F1-type ATP synthase membrane subunit b/b'
MKYSLKILRGTLAPALVLGFAMAVRAAEEGGNPVGQTIGTLFKWTHFVIVAGLLVYVIRKFGRPHFRLKADAISAAINKAAAAKAQAEKQLQEASVKLIHLEEEVAQFRAQAKTQAVAELERLRAMTKLDAEKIALAAKAEIEAAERAARVQLKALAAKLAVDRAESIVAKELTPAVQEAMLNQFVQNLQGRPN